MTVSEVMAMEAGPELNALAAEKVLGRKVRYIPVEEVVCEEDPTAPLGAYCNFGGGVFTADRDWLVDGYLDVEVNREVAPYSSGIAAAWELVEHCKARGGKPILWWDSDIRLWKANLGYEENGVGIISEAETAPLAICRASLMAVEGE